MERDIDNKGVLFGSLALFYILLLGLSIYTALPDAIPKIIGRLVELWVVIGVVGSTPLFISIIRDFYNLVPIKRAKLVQRQIVFKFLRESKSHKSISVGVLFAISLVILALSFRYPTGDLRNTLIVILPATIYYIYKAWLNQPSTKIEAEIEETIIPEHVPLNHQALESLFEDGSVEAGPNSAAEFDPDTFSFKPTNSQQVQLIKRGPIFRPVVYQTIMVKNVGTDSAKDAMIEVRIPELSETIDYFYARWTTQGSPHKYTLFPGQSHSVTISKTYITTRYSPGFGIVNGYQYEGGLEREHFVRHISINREWGPSGVLSYLPEIREEDVDPRLQVPYEKTTEGYDKSNPNNWKGNEIYLDEDEINDRFTIEARLIAENYRSPWTTVGEVNIPGGPVMSVKNEDSWADVWDRPIYREFPDRITEAVKNWMKNGMEFHRKARL